MDLAAAVARIESMNRGEFLLAAAAAPVALKVRRGGTPLALVTADTESRIAAVELSSGRMYRSVPTLPGPRSIESVLGTTAVVAHTAHGAVSLVDGRTLRVRHVLRDFTQPRYTAASPSGRYAFVTDSGSGEVVVVDLRRARVVHRTYLGGPARHVSIDSTGRSLWVSLGSKAPVVAVLDVRRPEALRVVGRIRPPFLAHDVGFAPDGRHVWVTSGAQNSVAIYDRRTREVLRVLAADEPPQHVTFAGRLVYVTSGDSGTLRVHRAADGRLLRTTPVPEGSYNVQQGWGVVLTPSLERGTLCVLDERGRLLHRKHVAASSHDACFVMSA